MKYINFEVNNGEKNMQIDKDLLDFAIDNNLKEPILRFYGWSPACISLGRNQSDDFLDQHLLKSLNIDVVKRLTGGRALLHDKELTYAYICPVSELKHGESIVNSYKEISQFLINGFKLLGIDLEFPENKKTNTKFDYCMFVSTGADLCFEDKKLIGSAQFRKNGYILQHGSILFDYNKELIEKIFNEKTDENTITCLQSINPDINHQKVINALNTSFENQYRII